MVAGNLCRCTGYQNIVAAVGRAAELAAELGHRALERASSRDHQALRRAQVQRVEDERLLRGGGRYTDDIAVSPDALAGRGAALARTRTRGSSTSTSTRCSTSTGVHAVWTYDDLTGPMAEPLPLLIPHPALTHGRTQYALAKDEVNYVGEADRVRRGRRTATSPRTPSTGSGSPTSLLDRWWASRAPARRRAPRPRRRPGQRRLRGWSSTSATRRPPIAAAPHRLDARPDHRAQCVHAAGGARHRRPLGLRHPAGCRCGPRRRPRPVSAPRSRPSSGSTWARST